VNIRIRRRPNFFFLNPWRRALGILLEKHMNPSQFTILLVEDDPDDVMNIERAFRKAKLANPLRIVNDGDAAVAYLSGQPPYDDREQNPTPTLVLLDLKLPRRSGLEVLEWIRGNQRLKRLPVVVLTSSRERADVNSAYDLHVNSYLVKPVAFDALLELVKSLNLYWIVCNEKPDVPGAAGSPVTKI
jgi:CheY-like chemotaxis protein